MIERSVFPEALTVVGGDGRLGRSDPTAMRKSSPVRELDACPSIGGAAGPVESAASYVLEMERGRSPDEIIVVAGVPRSGTSLVMQMLAAGGLALLCDGVRAPDDDNPRGYFELEAAKRLASDTSWLPSARGRAVKIVHALVPELPSHHSYRVLLVERRLDEVLASQDRMLARGGRERDAPAPGGSDDRLAVVFAGQLEAVRRWLDARPNVLWLPIRHADLIAQPEVCATRIGDFLGGSLDRVAMAAAVEPRLHRVRASDLPGNA